MGLDLHCKDKTLHCGYSYVHFVRKYLTQMTIEYLQTITFRDKFQPEESLKDYYIPSPHDDSQDKEIDHEEQEGDFNSRKKKLINFLEQTLIPNTILSQINYTIWSINSSDVDYYMKEFGIIGLKHFVNHSDCEGYLTLGESMDIISLISRIYKFKDKYISSDELRGDNIFFDDLIDLLKTSVDNKTYIVFG